MKWAAFILLVAVSQAAVLRETRDIPAPVLLRLVSLHPPGFKLEWQPVKSKNESEPVLGYKVKIWEHEMNKTQTYNFVNGVLTMVEGTSAPTKFGPDSFPQTEPTTIDITGAESSELTLENVKLGIFYEVRVQAYTSKGEGPLSRPMRLKLQED